MIEIYDNYIHIHTRNTSYVLRIKKETSHLLCEYYGKRIKVDDNFISLCEKPAFMKGTSIVYDEDVDSLFSTEHALMEYDVSLKGDYREPAIIIESDKYGYMFNPLFDSYEISKEIITPNDFPFPHSVDEELIIYLKDKVSNICLTLHYLIFEKCDVIAKYVELLNDGDENIRIKKIMSSQLDLINSQYELMNLYGSWASEANKERIRIPHGILINDSKTGFSSNLHNPYFSILEKDATYDHGNVYAFNLMYSGNHYATIELNSYNRLRIANGINPHLFAWLLKPGESFFTPASIMTFSCGGINGSAQNMHQFTLNHVIEPHWKEKERPILINNWEGTYFDFNETKLLSLARTAKKFGIELFVLDDGWFGKRDNDLAGLGDYWINKKKLPSGIDGLAKKINKIGLDFGLWFEPESINEDSDLYRAHPEYAIKNEYYHPSKSRHQLLLDLTKEEVQDYIIANVSSILASANIKYVKWDMNRPMSDLPALKDGHNGEFFHRYMLGFYRVCSTLTKKFPNVLFEGCASGGNRFDLGILRYFPQIWASDDTDAYERINIQSGLYLAYPPVCVSAHVSTSPSHQALRQTPLATRTNVAMFGAFGYELLLNELDKYEKDEAVKEIAFIKKHRHLLNNGIFYQFKDIKKDNYAIWMVISEDRKEAIIAHFNGLQTLLPSEAYLYGEHFIDDVLYKVEVLKQPHNIKKFGSLINTILPVHVNPNGMLVHSMSKRKTMESEIESYVVYGSMLNTPSIRLKPEWAGNGFDDKVRLLGDFGSRIYYIHAIKENDK